MTIVRKPTTFARALEDISRVLGWDGCAEVLGKSESHVRKLGAPDTEREISLRDALRLDKAYLRAGGDGCPLLECYALKMGMEMPVRQISASTLLAGASKAAKESGEAVAAAIEAAGDMSDPKARSRAAREIEEAITEMTRLLTSIVAPAQEDSRT